MLRRILDSLPADWEVALKRAAYRAYLAVSPNQAQIWFRYGNLEWLAGNVEVAENAYRRALQVDPNIRCDLVQQLINMRRLDEARHLLEPSLAKADQGWALASAARIARLQGRLDKARAILVRAQGQALEEPSFLAEQGRLLIEEGCYQEAFDHFERAQQVTGSPAAYWEERYWTLLALKRIEEAFPLTRFRKRKARLELPPNVALWRPGQPFVEAPFVLAEQGLGDEIKFATCYADLLRDAPRATITCHPKLHALFQRSFPGVTFVSVERQSPRQKRDGALLDAPGRAALALAKQCIVAADLLGQYRRDFASFKPRGPILVPDAELRKKWGRRLEVLDPGPKIGLSWTTLSQHPERLPHYTALADWLPVLTTPGVRFVNLQHGANAAELQLAAHHGNPLHIWSDFDVAEDLDDLAALMAELDLVISAHSMTKDLAGAIGARTWLVYHNADPQLAWRRGEDGRDLWFASVQHVVTEVPTKAEKAIAEVKRRLVSEFG